MKRSIILLLLALTSIHSYAGTPALENINESQFKKITKEFGANFVHTAVTPPESLGAVFGVEVGLLAGVTESDETNKVVKSVDADSKLEYVPHAGLMAQVSIPFGISFEATMLPETEASDLSIKAFSFAGKWTLTDSLLKIPFLDIATRFHIGSSEASYKTSDSVSSVPVDSEVKFETSSWGINLMAGPNLLLFKPYAGIGYVSTKTDLSVTSTTGTIFDTSFTTGKSASEKHSGAQFIVGAELDLFVLHIGAEYTKLLDTQKYTAKLSLAF